ncbi:MAG: glycosyltransferase [Candidatus Aureabacteria bacterium]|nr:glycosyltransferase [Candidatus Auribacterota bacterium]
MNVLFLTIRLPYPLDSGANIRTFNLIKYISERRNVILLSIFGSKRDNNEALAHLAKYCKEVKVVFNKERFSKAALFLKLICSIFTEKPATIFKYYFPDAKTKVLEIISTKKIGLIHCDHLHMAQYVEHITDIPKLLDEHNIEHLLIKRYVKEQKNLIKKLLVLFFQYVKLKKYESAMAQRFDYCTVVSDVDKKSLESIAPGVSAYVISNGVDINFYKPQQIEPQPNNLVFTGGMDWFPNEDAVLYFCDKVYPLIKKEIRNICLYIVGSNPSHRMLNLSRQNSGVVVTGYVEDVRPYIAKSSVYIVPLRIGGGSRLKILEAMAMGKAIVSTSIGCEGLEVIDNKNILISDSPSEFAAKTITLQRNNKLRVQLESNARELVMHKYSWDIIGKDLNALYDRII